MRILGRTPARLLENSRMLPWNLWGIAKSVGVFRRPFRVLRHYLGRTVPPDGLVETRSGLRIFLAGDEDDVVTVFLNFVRLDYGRVPRGSVVVDVGGHIGAFALFSVYQGARHVYCFEPDPQLFGTIQRNIQANRIASRVTAVNAAVTARDADAVPFRREGNAAGHVELAARLPGDHDSRLVQVKSVALGTLMETHRLPQIDLLKLDCEGSEYEIIETTPADVWRRIQRIRLEYHRGRGKEIQERFAALGFSVVNGHAHAASSGTGLLWLDRAIGNSAA